MKTSLLLNRMNPALEWAHCLVSPSHAQASSLRIDPRTERLALRVGAAVLVALFMAVAFVWGTAYGEYRIKQVYQNYSPPVHRVDRPNVQEV